MNPDALPFVALALTITTTLAIACNIGDWIESGRPSRLLERYRHWFDRVGRVEEYPGQYGPVDLTPEQIERRERTYAEADAAFNDPHEFARLMAAVEGDRRGDAA